MLVAERSTQKKSAYFLLMSTSFVLSVLTIVLSALPLKVLRSAYGFLIFAVSSLSLIAGLWIAGLQILALFLVGILVTVGVFSELESRSKGKGNLTWIGFLSVSIGSGAFWGALELWMKSEGWNLESKIHEQMGKVLAQATLLNPKMGEFTTELLIAQIPSVVFSVFMISLALSIIFERRMLGALRLSRSYIFGSLRPKDFKVPDVFVWVSMVAFLLSFKSFGLTGVEIVAVNVVNVMVILYLFQGVAVMEAVFHRYQVGPLFRTLFFLILIFQLFFVLSAVGFADFWLDIRKRLKVTKQPAEQIR